MQKPVTSNIPRGVGCPPPPGMDPRKGKGKLMCIKVRMLDDSVGVFHLGHKATGQALFDEVCRYLNLLESDYFGLEFIDSYGNRCWLDKEKGILRQILVAQSDARFFFVVKFYTPNPAELEEEYTRYLFALQIRRDLSRGELICSSENTAALLVALVVQSECGDFSPLDYPDAGAYLAGAHFVPHQTSAFAQAVMEQHRRLIGMEPAEADFVLLETARRCDFYGLRLHPARDIEGTEVALAVAHMGIKVFHQMNCVTTFSWAKVRKLSFKRKRLMIKVHPDSYQFYKETIEFSFENRDDCKNFWKKCVEHHSFFRCAEPMTKSGAEDNGTGGGRKSQPQQHSHHHHHLFTRGSNFQYRGRTQKQLIDYVREHRKRREPFQRPLRRGNALLSGGGTNFGTNSLGRTAQFLVSDRMPNNGAMGNGQQQNGRAKDEANFVCTFPSLCAQQNGGSNGRPKSAVIAAEKRSQRDSNNKSQQRRQQQQIAMQSSYHAGMAQHQEFRNGMVTATDAAVSAEAMALMHQHMDPMCMSMPNVLSTADVDAAPFGGGGVCHRRPSQTAAPSAADASAGACSFLLHSAHKSVSGENFHYAAELREENQSEGSYRVGWRCAHRRAAAPQRDDGAASSSAASSQSDIVSVTATSAHSPVDPRVYQTTFTTKRVGNVIMKRVMADGTAGGGANASAAAGKSSVHRRHPLTSRSAVDGGEPGDESDSLASSSVAFSDYSLATTVAAPSSAAAHFAAPTTTTSASSSASTAPSAAAAAAGGGRIRCTPPPTVAQPPQQHQQHQFTISSTNSNSSTTSQVLLPAHLRNEVPVPIDGPPPVHIVSRPGQQRRTAVPAKSVTTTATTTIIRPVLLPSPAAPAAIATTANSLDKGRATASLSSCSPTTTITNGSTVAVVGTAVLRPSSSSTASAASTPSQSTGVQRRPIVVAATAKGSPSPPPPPPPPILTIANNGGRTEAAGGSKQRRESVDGDAVTLDGPSDASAAIVKPKVPPKPDLSALLGGAGQHQQQQNRKDEVNLNLAGPLESILKDVRSMNEALDVLESPTGSSSAGLSRSISSQKVGAVTAPTVDGQQEQQIASITGPSAAAVLVPRHRPPDAISVESDECPSVRTVHLFNTGDNRVPYTLTVRDLSGGGGGGMGQQQQRKTAGADGDGKRQQWHGCGAATVVPPLSTAGTSDGRSRIATTPLEAKMVAMGAGGGGGAPRHKSLELVQRKRLPPQGAFSSQDHSITATSPEAGNVFEYVVAQRQRSASSDRSSITAQQNANKKRSAERRQTQPVEMVAREAEENGANAEACGRLAEKAKKCGDDHKMPSAEMAANHLQQGEETTTSAPQQQQQQQPQKLLETDF